MDSWPQPYWWAADDGGTEANALCALNHLARAAPLVHRSHAPDVFLGALARLTRTMARLPRRKRLTMSRHIVDAQHIGTLAHRGQRYRH